MTHPPRGSDYWWSGSDHVWQGNARTIFGELQAAGIRPVLTLRNVDNYGNPTWGRRLNQPRSSEDWNEWWEHVFATVYWLNVRNYYGVNDFQVGNEPNNSGQGWGGTIADYDAFIQFTYDAIRYVYRTYLPGRTFHVYAPVAGGRDWPREVMMRAGASFDAVDVHNYNADISVYTQHMRGLMSQRCHRRPSHAEQRPGHVHDSRHGGNPDHLFNACCRTATRARSRTIREINTGLRQP